MIKNISVIVNKKCKRSTKPNEAIAPKPEIRVSYELKYLTTLTKFHSR